jgi:hypothetical protein
VGGGEEVGSGGKMKEDESEDKDRTGAGTDDTEHDNARRILELMPISFLDKQKGITCTALYLLVDSPNK